MVGRQIIKVHEQERLEEQDLEYIRGLKLDFCSNYENSIPRHLGLTDDGWSSYYIGAAWISENCALTVLPKVKKIDFIKILSEALADDVNAEYFEEAYHINFDAPQIEDESLDSVLSPIMVAHYLSVINRLLKTGLKRNYIIREENLKTKIRGHIMPIKNLRINEIRGHKEKMMCRFQEYSVDYPENRLIKKALLACERLLSSLNIDCSRLLVPIRKALLPFYEVSDNVSPDEIRAVRKDKLHGEYPLAIKLAKLILKRTDMSISDSTNTKKLVPEFSVDMSRIFEFVVLNYLRRTFPSNKIMFQENAGILGRCDFLIPERHLIVDAKYKINFPYRSGDQLRGDIREVSGYGRSSRIRELCKISKGDNKMLSCLIIYPDETADANIIQYTTQSDISILGVPLAGTSNFNTLGIPYPQIK